jgi:uncharacterized protein (DUF1499 family)
MLFAAGCGARPAGLGVRDGRLVPCPASPNCVVSEGADAAHAVDAVPYRDALDAAHGRVIAALGALPRTVIVTDTPTYVHAESRTRILGFVDDLEVRLDDAAKVIHLRSASRVGWSDLGVNRRRVEALRAALAR